MKALLTALACLTLVACYIDAPKDVPLPVRELPWELPELERGANTFEESCRRCHDASLETFGPHWQSAAVRSPFEAHRSLSSNPRSEHDFPGISDSDLWNVSFFVASLGFDGVDAQAGRRALSSLTDLAPLSPRILAGASDAAIVEDLRSRGLSQDQANLALAFARTQAAFQSEDLPLSALRRDLSKALRLYRRGSQPQARALAREAHLNHLKHNLKVLRVRNPALALGTEQQLVRLRNKLAVGAPLDEVESESIALGVRLDASDDVLARRPRTMDAIRESATITLSFGVDGMLSIFLMFLVCTRRGSDPRERWVVGLGVVAGFAVSLSSLLTWDHLNAITPGTIRTCWSVALCTAITLTSMALLAMLVRHVEAPVQARHRASASWLMGLLVLSAGVVTRDALEIFPSVTILASSAPASLLGVAVSAVFLIFGVSLLTIWHRKLRASGQVALALTTTSVVATIAAGDAVRAMQDLDWVPQSVEAGPYSPLLAVWPSSQPVLVQMACAAVCAAILAAATLWPYEPR